MSTARRPRRRQPLAIVAVAVGLAVVLLVVFGEVLPAIDRAMRTTTVKDIEGALTVHPTPDGRLIVADAADPRDGHIVLFDPATGRQEVAADGIAGLRAAALDATGALCWIADTRLACESGFRADLDVPRGDLDATRRPAPVDILSDQAGGWFVSEPGRGQLLHVDRAARVSVFASFPALETTLGQVVPDKLSTDGRDTFGLALGKGGYLRFTAGAPLGLVTQREGGPGSVIAVVPSLFQAATLYLGSDGRGILGELRIEASPYRILERIDDPRAMTFTTEGAGRYAVISGGRLLLVRRPGS